MWSSPTPTNQKTLLIKTDSKYSIQCNALFTLFKVSAADCFGIGLTSWLQNWQRRDFISSSGSPVANRALIEYIAALLAEREASGQHVGFEHVNGHVGIEVNEVQTGLPMLELRGQSVVSLTGIC